MMLVYRKGPPRGRCPGPGPSHMIVVSILSESTVKCLHHFMGVDECNAIDFAVAGISPIIKVIRDRL